VQKTRVCHIASGDVWAGAEVQIATLLPELLTYPELDISAILLNKGRLVDELNQKGVRTIVLDETVLSSWQIIRRLVRAFGHQQLDILHTHGYKQHVLASIAAKWAGVPHVIKTVHGLQEPFWGIARLRISLYEYLDRLVTRLGTEK